MGTRKSLDQSLAKEFIYGEKEETKQTLDFSPATEATEPEKNKKASVKEATKRLTVDLPKSLHKRFSVTAIEVDRDKADIVRELIEKFIDGQ